MKAMRMLMLTTALTLAATPFAFAQMQGGGPGGGQPGTMMLQRFDTDNDGRISRSEFDAGEDQRFQQFDTNNDGRVTAEEFAAGRQARKAQRMQAMFEQADRDGDGALSRDEMSVRREARFSQLDANHDGQITPDEAAQGRARMQKMMGGGGPGMGRGGTPPSQP